jgi:phosphoribosylglycinamide formyltransferase-1
MSRLLIGVLASGGGSNFESLVAATRDGRLPDAEVRLLATNKPGAGALERAARLGVESLTLDPKGFPDADAYDEALAGEFRRRGVELVCLAGYLRKVGAPLLRAYAGRLLNIHPALLPKFGGPGMYGRRVHEAVLAAGEKESGCTVHVVDEEYDHGEPLLQSRVPVLPGDTPDALAARVLEQEHRTYPEAVRRWIDRRPAR